MKQLLIISMLGSLVFSPLFVYCQQTIAITVEGKKPGEFTGTAFTNHNLIKILKATLSPVAPTGISRSVNNSQANTGSVTIDKAPGASSVPFQNALLTRENLKLVTINFYKTGPNTGEQPYYKITLKNVFVTSINQLTGAASTNLFGPAHKSVDEIKLSYVGYQYTTLPGEKAPDLWVK